MLVLKIRKAELFVNNFDESNTAQTFVQYISGNELILRKIDLSISDVQNPSQSYQLIDNDDDVVSKSFIHVDPSDEDHNIWENRYKFEARYDWNNRH